MGTTESSGSSQGHVFLSHAGVDTEAARELVERLRRSGISVWFDRDSLSPGDAWMKTLEEAIRNSSAMLVYITSAGVQGWVEREFRSGLVLNTDDPNAFRLIPILGEGADIKSLPPFLAQQHCVDLRDRSRVTEEVQRLVEVLRNQSGHSAISPEYWETHSPFRSLQSFEPDDSWLFFGRDAETDVLLCRLTRAPVFSVLGNSGSGKSSLIRAGLLPALRRGRFRAGGKWVNSWRVCIFRPSERPFDELAESLAVQLSPELSAIEIKDFIEDCRERFPRGGNELRDAIASIVGSKAHTIDGPHVLIIADQFEEIFTLTSDKESREKYINLLLAAARIDGSVPVHVMLVMRADFYSRCLDHPALSHLLEGNLYNLPLIGPPQLREAIEKRLSLANVRAEPGLIDSLLAEVGTEPGNLALLEHALGQLWEKRRGSHTLTAAAYSEIGRLQGAISQHAEEVYRELVSEFQALAKRIFLELVQLGEGAQDTRRRVAKGVLLGLGNPEQVEQLLTRLATSRLISTGVQEHHPNRGSFVEVSHEALIREWPTLREWLEENRDDIRLERRLIEAAEEWRESRRDSGALLYGARLAQAEHWLANHADAPSLLRAFLESSRDSHEEVIRKVREAEELELAREQQLRQEAEARANAERLLRQEADRRILSEGAVITQALRSAKHFRWFSCALGFLLVVAAGAAWLAKQARTHASSRQLAAEASLLMDREPYLINRAALLAVESVRKEASLSGDVALRGAISLLPREIARLSHSENVRDFVFSPDGSRLLAVVREDNSDRSLIVEWDVNKNQEVARMQVLDLIPVVAYAPDGPRVLTRYHTVRGEPLCTVAQFPSGRELFHRSGSSAAMQFNIRSWTGTHVPLSISQTDLRIEWIGDPSRSLEVRTGAPIESALFAADGNHLVIDTFEDRYVARLDRQGPINHFRRRGRFNGTTSAVSAGTSDHLRVAVADLFMDSRGDAVVIDEQGSELIRLRHEGEYESIALTTDGQMVSTVSLHRGVRIWHLPEGREIARLSNDGNVVRVAFDRDGCRVASGTGKELRVFDICHRP